MRNNAIYRFCRSIYECLHWHARKYDSPSPHFVKQSCLLRNGFPSATWIETGTYLGQTTQLLSKNASKVYSIEPEPKLFARARNFFRNYSNVEILSGTSEDVFPILLPRIGGDVNFWLDGHYSAGITFKGQQDTPILDELDCISRNINHFSKVCVLVDDIRCFNPRLPEYASYPSVDKLVEWANKHQLIWHIEHDIFIAKST